MSSIITKLSTENESLKEQLIELPTLYNIKAQAQTGRHPDDINPDQDFGDQ